MNPTIHRHGFLARISRFSAPLLTICATFLSVYYLIIGILSLAHISNYDNIPFSNYVTVIISYGLIAYWGISRYLLFVDIDADTEGLHIKVFIKPITIKWNEIVEVKSVILFGFIERPKKRIVITKSKLPFVFQIIGLLQGKTFSPSLRINSSISDYSVLMKRISKSARQNQRAESKAQKEKKQSNN